MDLVNILWTEPIKKNKKEQRKTLFYQGSPPFSLVNKGWHKNKRVMGIEPTYIVLKTLIL
jgi:hypothetical protein